MDDPRKQGPQQGPIDWSEFIKQAQQSGAGADFNKIKSRFSHLKKRTIIIAAVVLVLVLALAYWWFHPAINIQSIDLWGFLIVILALVTFVLFVFRQIYQAGMGKREKSPKKVKLFSDRYRGHRCCWLARLAILLPGQCREVFNGPGYRRRRFRYRYS